MLAFPLALPLLADLLPIQAVKFRLKHNQELSGLGSGQILAAELAPSLWTADVTLGESRHAIMDGIQARFEALDGSLKAFYLYDPKRRFPQADPDGSRLGSAAPTIRALGGDAQTLALQRLPAGYLLSVGDLISFDFGQPARRALHRVVETAVADARGETSLFEVRPFIRAGVEIGLPVAVVNPAMKCIVQPDTFDVDTTRSTHSKASFSVIQRL